MSSPMGVVGTSALSPAVDVGVAGTSTLSPVVDVGCLLLLMWVVSCC